MPVLAPPRAICSALAAMLATMVVATASRAEPPSLTRDLVIEQQRIADIPIPDSDLKVTAWFDRADETYRVGETAQILIKTNRDAYITVLDVGTSGKVHILFPNRFAKDNHVLAHQVLQIPGPDAPYRVRVGGPAGNELITVIATTRPGALIAPDKLAEAGPFSTYRGTAEGLTRDLAIELPAAAPAPGTEGGAGKVNKVLRIKEDHGALSPPAVAPASLAGAGPPVSAEELYRLGEASFYGDGGSTNGREALRYFTLAAEAGHVGAMFRIGRIHETGLDVDQSPVLALDWYRKAAEKGSTQAMVRLAILSARPGDPHRDLAEAARWLKKAAGQGDGMAMLHVAKMHDEGLGVERSPGEAARHLLAALKTGAWTALDQAARLSEATRRELQAQLRQSGHYSGPLDALVGPETRAAMVEWAKAGA